MEIYLNGITDKDRPLDEIRILTTGKRDPSVKSRAGIRTGLHPMTHTGGKPEHAMPRRCPASSVTRRMQTKIGTRFERTLVERAAKTTGPGAGEGVEQPELYRRS